MNGYEKLIKTMRSEATRNLSKYPLRLCEMLSPTSCKYGQLVLDADDLLFSEHLVKSIMSELDISINYNLGYTDNSAYISPLKKGDKVLVCQISDDKFAVLERLVEVV